jgi:YHS domain-containing protein
MKQIKKPKHLLVRSSYHKRYSQQLSYFMLRLFLVTVILLAMLGITNAQHFEEKYFNNIDDNGVILNGYDPVAFFTDGKPVKGDPGLQYKYNDATYYFASQEHLRLFKENPEKYKPQFGGWCAYAVSLGRIAPINVSTFSIVNGRLVIQHNQRAVNGWNEDVQGNLKLADKYWPEVVKHEGKQITTDEEKAFLNNVDREGITLQGYDAVAYFTENKAVKGDAKFTARYNGATYWFSSQEHADTFKDKPAMFAPQYGSFCGYAMSLGKLRPIDPSIFQFVDGRLILQHTRDAYNQFNKDIEGNTAKADRNWPEQVKKHAGKKIKFDKPAKPAVAEAGK